MPNAKNLNIHETGKPKILLVGQGGSGKTSQMLTLPGRTFAYLFDPSALSTLRGHDIDYEMFAPGKVRMTAQALAEKAKKDKVIGEETASDVYVDWEKDFEERTKTGYWDTVDNICFDSFTTFSDVVMDRILFLNSRVGHFPQQDDWTAQMATIMNVVRTLASMEKLLLFTAHDEFKQDDTTTRMQNVIILTGRLRTKIPLLFSDIWHTECQATPKVVKYTAQTRPDRMNPAIRCSMRGLEMFEDVTITNWDKPKESGLGKLVRTKLGYNPPPRTVRKEDGQAGLSSVPTGQVAKAAGQVGSV